MAGSTKLYRLGMVVTAQTSYRGDEINPEIIRNELSTGSPKAILDRLALEVHALGIPSLIQELEYIESRMKPQNYGFTGRHDPAVYALESLHRALLIAGTEAHFQLLMKHNRNAKSRAQTLQRNRAAVAHFPPDSAEERKLVKDFDALRNKKMPVRNIPAKLHADYAKREEAPPLMAIRRALMRLEFIAPTKPKKK